ncbi:DUF1036 domain-containing protein [Neorhizobium sp. T7_12]|uniref:DUF1036 domain-containing protein n=1 Tax=Neorhizobium sp. T7_12 TaxID=2093832 RepID=UPI00155EAF10|nr:DUF1036 domain-containing protein [Neorhizobium sp. T7_12]
MKIFLLLLSLILGSSTAFANDDVEQGYGSGPDESSIRSEAVEKKFVDSEIMSLEVRYGFTLAICNKTKTKMSIALYHKLNHLVQTEDYAVQGWYDIPGNACETIENMAKGDFAFFAANASGREWGGKDFRLCVEKGRFKKIIFPDAICDSGLRKGFKKIQINSENETINLN